MCRAHDQALARSGKSITASDVIKAITEMDFGPADNLIPLLEIELACKSSDTRVHQTRSALMGSLSSTEPAKQADKGCCS